MHSTHVFERACLTITGRRGRTCEVSSVDMQPDRKFWVAGMHAALQKSGARIVYALGVSVSSEGQRVCRAIARRHSSVQDVACFVRADESCLLRVDGRYDVNFPPNKLVSDP